MTPTLLELLEAKPGQYVSGETISKELGVSRTAVWKQIRKLEEAGYRFEASRRLGYRLVGKPDRLTADTLLGQLRTQRFGRRVYLYDELGSTQDAAQKLAEEGAEEGTLVIAERQLNGKARMGRSWISPFGKGIWMSMVLRPPLPVHSAPQITLLIAVALCRSLRRNTGLTIGIKWPNDLLVNGKKISGILLESSAEDERLRYIVAGVGISVNLEPADYTPEVAAKATSLAIECGRKLDRTALLADFLGEWEQLYELYLTEGFGPVKSLWEALAVVLNRPAVLTTPQGIVEGTPIALDDSGAIKVRKKDGTVIDVFSAEMGEPAEEGGE